MSSTQHFQGRRDIPGNDESDSDIEVKVAKAHPLVHLVGEAHSS